MAINTTKGPGGKTRRRGVTTRGAISTNCKNKPVTGLNEAAYTLEDHVFATNTVKLANAGRRKDKSAKIERYFATTFEYQLWRGDTPFGAPKTMTGREAWELNRKFGLKFFDDKSPNARLWCWYVVGVRPPTNGLTLAQTRRQRFESSPDSTKGDKGK